MREQELGIARCTRLDGGSHPRIECNHTICGNHTQGRDCAKGIGLRIETRIAEQLRDSQQSCRIAGNRTAQNHPGITGQNHRQIR
jgi:hypothetical protein